MSTTGGEIEKAHQGDLAEERYATIFRAALSKVPEAAFDLTPETLRRYMAGLLPQSFRWLLRYPKLMRILADLAEQDQLRLEATPINESRLLQLIQASGIELIQQEQFQNGWLWRIDGLADWDGPYDSPEEAIAAALRFLVTHARAKKVKKPQPKH